MNSEDRTPLSKEARVAANAAPQHVTVLSGGGSPRGDAYAPVYQLIRDQGAALGINVQIVDYVGIGHAPEFGSGLNLPRAVEKARREIERAAPPAGSTLVCRSFGCNVGSYLLARHRNEMKCFARAVFWGPSAFHTFWEVMGRNSGVLQHFNDEARKKGAVMSQDFWATLQPVETTARDIAEVSLAIGYGTKDKYCDAPFAHYLAAIIRACTTCEVEVVEIEKAEHEVRANAPLGVSADEHEQVKRRYLSLIFGTQLA